MNLIVRVKRRRDQEPSDSIWIMDDTEAPSKKKSSTRKITESLGALSTSTNQVEPRSTKLYMSRVQTVEVGGEADLDKSALSASLSRVQKREREDSDLQNVRIEDKIQNESSLILQSRTDPDRITKDSSSMWITNGKKVLRSSYTLEKFVVVDVSQIPYSRPSLVISSSLPEGSNALISGVKKTDINNPVKKSLVIDPATRKLDVAIDKAIKLNDFNEMVQALQIGANVNYQRRSDGMTALMAAAMQKNSRMVSRLIAKDADVFLLDTSGKTAMDHVKKDHNKSHTGNSHVQNASVEITLLLHKTAVKAQQLANKRQQRSDEEEEAMRMNGGLVPRAEAGASTATISTSPLLSDSGVESSRVTDITDLPDGEEIGVEERNKQIAEENDDYVVDIYMRSDGLTSEEGSGNVESSENYHAPIVQIEGLHINQSGDVELVFQYDSDWSDLADDEEPDSNDERFEGNDYPEEGEEGEGVDDEDTDDEDKYAALRADIEDGEGAGSGYGRRNKHGDGGDEEMEGLDYGFTGGNGSSRRVERFNRNSVGRVLRPHMMDDEGDGGVMSQKRDPEALQQLWGLREGGGDDDYEEDEEDDNNAVNNKFRSERAEHNQRVKGMRAGTGMQFAANPREFDRSGLPKYGAELSDEEGDIELYEDILMDENKPSTVTFAPSLTASNIIHSRLHNQEIDVERSADYDDMDTDMGLNTGGSTGSGSRGGKMNHLDVIRKEVRETAAARAKGDLTGDNNYRLFHTLCVFKHFYIFMCILCYVHMNVLFNMSPQYSTIFNI
jgi:hypothetical protein